MTLIYVGDYRLRLRQASWRWYGLKDRRWEVTFERGPQLAFASHRHFTVAVALALWRIYCSALHWPWQ